MKITDMEVLVVREGERVDGRPAGSRPLDPPRRFEDHVVVTIRTDEGIEGHAFGQGVKGGRRLAEAIVSVFKPEILGEDPIDREYLFQKLMRADRFSGHVPILAHGPVDVALWDITAKKFGIPIYKLIGGYRDKVKAYATSNRFETPEEFVEAAKQAVARGFTAFKLHTPGTVEGDIACCRAVREAMGPDLVLMSDPVAAFNREEALKVGRELEKLDFYWYEEPLHDYDIYGYKKLSDDLDIPVAACEWASGMYFTAAEFIHREAVDIIRSDCSWKGGFSGFLKTAHLCEAFGMNVEIHMGCTPLMEVANLHAACGIKNCQYLELPVWPVQFGLKEPIPIDSEGYVHAPQAPGLGWELDWDTLNEKTVDRL